jgi:hypothetical protein
MRVARTISEIPSVVSFRPLPSGNQGMFKLADHMAARIREIDKFDKEHAAEIAEFERLKAKLGR